MFGIGEKKEPAEKKPKSKVRRIFDALFTVFFIGLCICFGTVITQIAKGDQPNLFGYSFATIETGSMEGTDEFYEGKNFKIGRLDIGDVIVEKLIDSEDCYTLQPGDIISYEGTITLSGSNVEASITHRVISNDPETMTLVVQGDANSKADDPVSYDKVIAKVTRNSGFMKLVYKTLSSFWGFAILIFIPMFVMLILQVYQMLLARKTDKINEDTAKKQQEAAAAAEKRKKELEEQAIAEYLASLEKKEEPVSEPPAEEPAPVSEEASKTENDENVSE